MDVYTLSNNRLVLTEPPLSSGGEGAVYELRDYPGRVAKIYHDPADALIREDKIAAMVSIRQGDGFRRSGLGRDIAWPLAPLYDSQRRFIGFGMPRIAADTELDDLYAYPAEGRPISIKDRVNILINLCDVIDRLHTTGQVFGDFNPNNIKVRSDGTVNFVDADSYHIHCGGRQYRCVVCAPGYVAPEVLRACKGTTYADCPGTTFTENTDHFALAIHVFRMLMNGCHPFICERHLPRAGSAPAAKSADKRVEAGETPFFKTIPNYTTPHYAPDLAAFPPYLRDLFRRAFVDGHTNPDSRPRAAEWKRALLRFSSELTACSRDPSHYHWRGARSCPYCEADARHASKMAQLMSPPALRPAFTPPPTVQPAAPSPSHAPAVSPRTQAAATPHAKRSLCFWIVTLLVSLSVQLLLAQNLLPAAYEALFEGDSLRRFGVGCSIAAALWGCSIYNMEWAYSRHTGRYRWWEYILSVLVSLAFSAGVIAVVALGALALKGVLYFFLVLMVIVGILSIFSL